MSSNHAYIHAISYFLPETRLTNKELSEIFDWKEEKITSKVGIYERRVTKDDEFVSDLAEKAALKLFEEQNIDPSEIDFILLCTQSPDYLLPTTACILQERLQIPTTCGALDFNLGCSGFIYGLALAKSLIMSEMAGNVLLIMSDTYTKNINPYDKSTRTIFGDGAAAVLVKGGVEENKIRKFVLGTDGKGANNLIIPAGGMKLPRSENTSVPQRDRFGNVRSLNNLYMNGPKICEFTLNNVPRLIEDILIKNDLKFEDIDLFIFHQASLMVLEGLRKEINIPKEKFFINIENIGNTVSSSIPIALKDAEDCGKIKKSDIVMVVGFGVGYSWGGTIIEY